MEAQDTFRFEDDLGPKRIIHVSVKPIGLRGILVVDNVACGPSIGGLRMAPDVSVEECFRLARAMSMKNAAAGLAHGGGKSVIFADPNQPLEKKERLVRAFAAALGDCEDYIFGPDMGTNETCMAWVKDEIGRAVGLPPEVGGIPLDEIGATGWGLRHACEVAAPYAGIELKGARIVVQGFGSVGRHAARFLAECGTKLVGAADSRGAVANPDGLDYDELVSLKKAGRSVAEATRGKRIEAEELVGLDCEIWIPAARPDVIHEKNVDRVKAKLIAPGANIATTAGAEERLHKKGIVCLPDFIANAGGVICAAMEYEGATEAAAMETIRARIRANTAAVLERSKAEGKRPRAAAEQISTERIKSAMRYRRWMLF